MGGKMHGTAWASGRSLDVLIVDDSESDYRLMVALLEEEGWELRARRLDTPEAFAAALHEHWDIILCDESMPRFDARSAYDMVLKASVDVPFVIVSGEICGETALEAMRHGVRDFVKKDDWMRLPPVVLRELQPRRRSPVALAESGVGRFADSLPIAAVILCGGRVVHPNPHFCQLLGYSGSDLQNRPFSQLVHQTYRTRAREFLSATVPSRRHARYEVPMLSRGGELCWTEIAIGVLEEEGSELILTVRDITELQHAREQISFFAAHDPLTGLPNWEHLCEETSRALVRAQSNGTRLALISLDLDRFKLINEGLGHRAGDELLRDVARRLSETLPHPGRVGRLSGDEFMVVLEELPKNWCPDAAVEQIRATVRGPFQIQGQHLTFSAGVGVGVYPDHARDIHGLLRHAAAGMRAQKRRSHMTQAEWAVGTDPLELVRLQNDLCGALERGELYLRYQPQVDIKEGLLIGAEALLRWHHPQLGEISPGLFIPLAEQSGDILPIGDWTLREACRQGQRWRTSLGRDVPVAVNISARHFVAEELEGAVRSALADSGLPPHCLELELTESILVDKPDAVVATMNALKRIGVRLSVDDFGTGYSSLSYLKRFPVDTLKVDRLFVKDITANARDCVIAGNIINLGQSLGMRVIAEGVETVDQLAIIHDLGCRTVQGFHYSRPVPAEAVASLVRRGFDCVGQLRAS